MYRVALEHILGFQIRDGKLHFNPCIPNHWPDFEITFRHGAATYHIKVENPAHVQQGVHAVFLDEQQCSASEVPLVTAAGEHVVRVVMG